jgi:hypothetical protein
MSLPGPLLLTCPTSPIRQVKTLAPTPPNNRPKRRGLGVGEPVGARLVLKGGRPLFARRLLFTSQCSLPGLPASQTPIFRVRTTLWRKPHGHAEELLGLQYEDADFDRGTIRHTVSDSIVARHSRHRCVVLRLAYLLPVVRGSGGAYPQGISNVKVTLPHPYRGVAIPLRSPFRL